MAEKRQYSPEEVKVFLDINTSLTNIANAMSIMKDTMNDLVELEKKHGTDLQLFNERIKFLQDLYVTLGEAMEEIKNKVSTLTTQLDYKERIELQTNILKNKNKDKNKDKIDKPKMSVWPFVAKNIKWITVSIVSIAVIVVLIIGGPTLFKEFTDLLANIFGGNAK